MTSETFLANPSDHVQFMLDYLREHYGNRQGINSNEQAELEHLREEVGQLKSQLREISLGSTEDYDSANHKTLSSHDSDEEIEDVHELSNSNIASQGRGHRGSVSAEAFGSWNKKEEFVPPCYEKLPDVMSHLKDRLDQAFMFSSLNPDELDVVLLAMHSISFKAGETVITQGDDGNELYVVEEGTLTCEKTMVSIFLGL